MTAPDSRTGQDVASPESPLGPTPVEDGEDLPLAVPEAAALSARDAAARRRKKEGSFKETTLPRVGGLVIFFASWYAVAAWLDTRFFPYPHAVLEAFWDILSTGLFHQNLWITVLRVLGGFTGAMVVSVVVGVGMGLWRTFASAFEGFVLVGLTVPGLVWALISVMWFGISEWSAIFAIVVIVAPILILNIWEGTRSMDVKLIQMGRSFGASQSQRIRHIVLPHLAPYIFAASRIGFSLAWKVVVLVELLGQSNGVGYELHRAYNLFSIERVMAWTFGFMLIMAVVELAFFRRVEAHVTRWRLG